VLDDATTLRRTRTLAEHTVTLEAGHAYALRIECAQNYGSVGLEFVWRPPAEFLRAQAVNAVNASDVTVAVLGINANLEGEQMPVNIPGFSGGDRTTLDLPESQEKLLEAAIATGKPVIVVLQSGSAISANYAAEHAAAVLEAGGLPVPIAYGDAEAAGAYLALCQGIVLTGGDFDIGPELYGEARRPCCGAEKAGRTAFEWALCEAALAGRIPLLGICNGMQLMNVVRGGSLYQDLAQDLGEAGHEQAAPKDLPSHEVEIVADSLLARLVGPQALAVNSTHHQAVRRPGAGVLVSARAPDDVIEAIELPDLPFAVGVQWHPERARGGRQAGLFRGLVLAAEDLRRS